MIRNTRKSIYDIFKGFLGILIKWYDDMLIDEQSFRLNKEEVKYWKNQMFYITLTVVLLVGAPLMCYGSYVFYRSGMWANAYVELLFYVLGAVFLIHKRISMDIKKPFLILMVYSVSIFLIFTADVLGSGLLGVLFTLILAGCILDKNQLVPFLVINYLVFILITILLYTDLLAGTTVMRYKEVWVINAGTAQGCGLMLLVLMNAIYTGLEKQAQLIKQSQAIIAASEIKHKVMIRNISDAIFVVDQVGTVSYHSPNLQERFPWMSQNMLDHSLIEEFHPSDRDYLHSTLEGLLIQPEKSGTIEVRYQKNESTGYVEMTATNLLQDENIKGILINCRDITERKVREEEIMFLYKHDYLTGLCNRAAYEIELNRLDDSHYYPLSIIMGDINGLKMINDSLGHDEGDKLLFAMAEILKSCCREEDIVTRLGGDEFIIALPNMDSEQALEVIQSIYDTCTEYNKKVHNEIYHISISLGAATKKNSKEDIKNVIKLAEDFMYKRKLLEGRSFHSSVIASMKTALFEKSFETEQHANRLVELSRMVGEAIGLTRQQFDELELLDSLHDIGKIGIKDQILNKPGKLTAEEWVEMKKHSEIGYRIAMSSPDLMSIAFYILTHHEHWDGSGYPQALAGERIPLLSRILSVTDAYDAMTQDRPYRNGMSKQDALEEITCNAGTHFDPQIAELFVRLMKSNNCDNAEFTN